MASSSSSSSASAFPSSYAGFSPRAGWAVAERPRGAVSARELFELAVRPCAPLVLRGGAGAGGAPPLFSLADLERAAGASPVLVERRGAGAGKGAPGGGGGAAFGLGRRERMAFGDFAQRLRAGDEDLYLSTQPVPDDAATGLPALLVAPPLSALRAAAGGGAPAAAAAAAAAASAGRKRARPAGAEAPPSSAAAASPFAFPLRPALAGALLPAAVNVWAGASRRGASSGLHHDFHANLYELLAGRKRFTVAAPGEAPRMYARGATAAVHANGLISYRGAETAADGRPVGGGAEEDGEDGEEGGVEAGEDEEEEEDAGDADAMWAALTAMAAPAKRGAPSKGRGSKAKGAAAAAAAPHRAVRAATAAGAADAPADADADAGGPNHFSRIPLAALRAAASARLRARAGAGAPPPSAAAVLREAQASREVASRFPLFAGAALASFELRAGDALFLPQGWWHEVESVGDGGEGEGEGGGKAGEGEGGRGLHMALNWWFHPPTEPSFAAPYARAARDTFEAAFRKQVAAHRAEAEAEAVAEAEAEAEDERRAGAAAEAGTPGADAARPRGGARKRRA